MARHDYVSQQVSQDGSELKGSDDYLEKFCSKKALESENGHPGLAPPFRESVAGNSSRSCFGHPLSELQVHNNYSVLPAAMYKSAACFKPYPKS